MRIVNMTGHNVELTCGIIFSPQKRLRLKRKYTHIDDVFALDEAHKIDLPAEEEGTLFLVSAIIYHKNPGRTDLISPMTGVRGVKTSKRSRKAQVVPGLFTRVNHKG